MVKTLEKMKVKSTYKSFDFESETIWIMEEFPEIVF